MKSKIIIPLLMILLLASIVTATYTITWSLPGEYSVQNVTAVPVNITVIDTLANSTNKDFNCSIYNATNRSQEAWTEIQLGNVSNGTNFQTTVTYADLSRQYVKLSCYDQEGEWSITDEVIVMPAVDTQVDLAQDTYQILNASGVQAWVNYTQDVTNEGEVGVANNTQVDLAGNTTIFEVSAAQVNASTSATMESQTLGVNLSKVNLTGDGYVIAVGAMVVYNGSANITHDTSSYVLTAGVVNLTNSSLIGNTSYWNYTYYSWQTFTDYVLATGSVTIGPLNTYNLNNTRWNYSYYNPTVLAEGTDWNITSGLVIFNSSTGYAGDISYWNYSYPGATNANEVNTSIRMFDVDTEYWDWLNISLGVSIAGDLFVTGTATFLNLIATNLEGDLDGTGYDLTIEDITANGNVDVDDNLTGDFYYGGMWYHNHTATAMEFAVDGIFYPLFFTNATNLNGFTFAGGFNISSNLTALVAGKYQAHYMATGDGQNNHVYYTTIAINENNVSNCGSHKKMTAGGDIVTMTGNCIIDLEIDDVLTLRTADIGATGDGNFYSANLNVVRIGD